MAANWERLARGRPNRLEYTRSTTTFGERTGGAMSTIPLEEAIGRARRALAEGRLDEAKELCQAIRRAVPEALVGLRLWSEVSRQEGDAETAERLLGVVLERDPEDAEAWCALAELHRARGDKEAALRLLQVAWECAPWRRELAERLGEWANEERREGRLWPTRAALSAWYERQGWWTRAAEECRALLTGSGERVDVRQRLIRCLWRAGEQEEACRAAETLLGERGETVGALVVAALVARSRGDEEAAQAHRERLWALDPVGEGIERYWGPEEREGREWLRATGPVLVEEPAFAEASGELELLWELPTDEELEEARPGSVEVGTGVEETGRADEVAVVSGLEIGDRVGVESTSQGWTLPSDEEIEAARPREELEPGWTGLLEELAASGVEPFSCDEESVSGGPAEGEGAVVAGQEESVAATGEETRESGEEAREPLQVVEFGRAAREERESVETAAELAGDEIEQVRMLLESGAVLEAVRVAQRLVRERHSDIAALVPLLERVVSGEGSGAREAAMTLGAIYRRRGDRAVASRYYELALRLRNE